MDPNVSKKRSFSELNELVDASRVVASVHVDDDRVLDEWEAYQVEQQQKAYILRHEQTRARICITIRQCESDVHNYANWKTHHSTWIFHVREDSGDNGTIMHVPIIVACVPCMDGVNTMYASGMETLLFSTKPSLNVSEYINLYAERLDDGLLWYRSDLWQTREIEMAQSQSRLDAALLARSQMDAEYAEQQQKYQR